MTMGRHILAGLALSAVAVAFGSSSALAVDSGTWFNGCVTGNICFWTGGSETGVAISSPTRDSDFRDNSLNGHTLDEGAQSWGNHYTGATKVRVWTDINYSNTTSSCFGKGFYVTGYPILSSHSATQGTSSFTSVGC